MRKGGFTLVELLIVIAIIGVLAGLVLVAVGGVTSRAKVAVAKTMIDNLRTSLTAYNSDVGYYPPGNAENDEGNINMVLALFDVNEADGGKGGPNSPYFEFKESDLKPSKYAGTMQVLIDPWGSPYIYIRARDDNGNLKDGIHNVHSYDLWSIGPNMVDDKGEKDKEDEKDDISNWQ